MKRNGLVRQPFISVGRPRPASVRWWRPVLSRVLWEQMNIINQGCLHHINEVLNIITCLATNCHYVSYECALDWVTSAHRVGVCVLEGVGW